MKRDLWQAVIHFIQLGLSLAAPPVGMSLLAFWARRQFSLGPWASVMALVIGGGLSLATSVSLFRAFFRMQQEKRDPP